MAIIYQPTMMLRINNFFTFSLFLIFIGCNESDEFSSEQLRKFDSTNSVLIADICKSLKLAVGVDTSFLMEYRPRSRDIYFSYRDSSGNGIGYFKPFFKLTKLQEHFLTESIIHEVKFNSIKDEFTIRIFKFKKGDKAVYLKITNDSIKMSNEKIIYSLGNRYYYQSNAW